MNSLREGIRAISRLPDAWRSSWHATGFDADEVLIDLRKAARECEQRVLGRKPTPVPDPEAYNSALAAWRGAGCRLDRLSAPQIRILCLRQESGLHPAFLDGLRLHPLLIKRRSWAEALIGLYLQNWRPMDHADQIESSLRHVLQTFPENAGWLEPFRPGPWAVIGPSAPDAIVRGMRDPSSDLESCLDLWGLEARCGLGLAVTEQALRTWADNFRHRRPSGNGEAERKELQRAFSSLFSAIPLGRTFYGAFEDLVLSEWAKSSTGLREDIVSWALAHPELGDPRRNVGGWHPAPLAKAKVLAWMARRDLTFFYDSIVPSHQDDQGRKAFWLRYVDRVTDFQLVLSGKDKPKLSTTQKAQGYISTMEGMNSPSAFLLRFRDEVQNDDFICVEFSESGNALFIYEQQVFERSIADLHALYFRISDGPRNLKQRFLAKVWKPHQGNWQRDISWYLQQRGVSPV